MSESWLSFIIIFAQLGGVLLIAGTAWFFCFLSKARKDDENTKKLIQAVKLLIPQRRDKLNEFFKNADEQAENNDINVDSLIKKEKKLYEHLINASLNKDTNLIKLSSGDVDVLISDYISMLTLKGSRNSEIVSESSDDSKESRELILKKENESLRLENTSLQKRLDTSNETIENMMQEFSSMYEGGKKEGEQRLKNEMYQLKQSLESEELKIKSELEELNKKEET